MAQTTTHKDAMVPSSELTVVEDKTDMAMATSLHKSDAEKILHIVETRTENRVGDEYDIIILLEEWAYEDWSDYDISDNKVMIVGHISDYSDKAFRLGGAFEVRMDEMDGRSFEEVKDEYITSLVEVVDETHTDYHDEKGDMYLPKSAVASILVYKP